MNTESEPPEEMSEPTSFRHLVGKDDAETPTDKALASLESQLQAEKDARLEERFLWIVISVVLLDIIWFRNVSNAALPIVALVLELVALLVIARRMQVDDFVQLVGRVLHGVGQRGVGG